MPANAAGMAARLERFPPVLNGWGFPRRRFSDAGFVPVRGGRHGCRECCLMIFGIDAHAAFILGAIEAKDDVTLVELQALLAERGTPVGIGTLWRFFDRHRITRKKDGARHRAGSPRRPETPRSRAAGLHRRDLGIDQHGAAPWPLSPRRAAALRGAAWALEDHHPRRRPAPHRHGSANGARRSDQPRCLRRLCPPSARVRPEAGRHRSWTTCRATKRPRHAMRSKRLAQKGDRRGRDGRLERNGNQGSNGRIHLPPTARIAPPPRPVTHFQMQAAERDSLSWRSLLSPLE